MDLWLHSPTIFVRPVLKNIMQHRTQGSPSAYSYGVHRSSCAISNHLRRRAWERGYVHSYSTIYCTGGSLETRLVVYTCTFTLMYISCSCLHNTTVTTSHIPAVLSAAAGAPPGGTSYRKEKREVSTSYMSITYIYIYTSTVVHKIFVGK